MTEMILDTQKMVDRLQEAGVPPAQARAHAALLVEVINSMDGHGAECYATKDAVSRSVDELRSEIRRLETKLDASSAETKAEFATMRAEFGKVRAETQSGLDNLRTELTKWTLTVVATVGILQTALITALLLKLVG